jgi:multidrug efflux system outer membrane protein
MKYRTTSIGFAVLAACSPVGPDYVPPDIVLPAQFIGNSGTAFVRAADIAWWERLDQPVLNALVTRGAAQNLDVAFAIERIRAADAALGQTGLNGQVGGTITADITRSRFDDQRDTRDRERKLCAGSVWWGSPWPGTGAGDLRCGTA